MPKEVNLTGEEVVALTKEYLTEEDVHFVHKAFGLCRWNATVANTANQASLYHSPHPSGRYFS